MILVSLSLALLAGCDVRKSWEEEVQLADGQIVVVERRSVAERFGELGGGGGRAKYWSVTFGGPPRLTWDGDLRPVAFHINDENAWILSRINLEWVECKKYGYPNPPYVLFGFDVKANAWDRVDLRQLPTGVSVNLLQSAWSEWREAQKPLITLKDKAILDRGNIHAQERIDKLAPLPPDRSCEKVRLED